MGPEPGGPGEAERGTRAERETPRRKRCREGRRVGPACAAAARKAPPPRLPLAPPRGPAPSSAAHPRAPPADGSESEAERLTSRRHRQTSPRVRRVNQPERRRRRQRQDRRGAGAATRRERKARGDAGCGDPVTAGAAAVAAAARGGGRAPAEGSGWGAVRAGRGARGGQGPWRPRRRLHGARQVVRGPGGRPANALPPGPAGTSRRRRRRGTARFAEGVKCLKYGGGSESPRPPPPTTRSLPPARGRRSLSRCPPSPAGLPGTLVPRAGAPSLATPVPSWVWVEVRTETRKLSFEKTQLPPAPSQDGERSGKPLPGALQAPA
ncbi:translation initiation factor IF-2-like [Lynx canadensis]|uniref:translation initiation factor IF-2-like n=1 Tax=Lynx canadensis TaxID=61383 RepID=UPI0011B072DC|nr:translation initiation factor IF-2-like [Lynx canadensis]